MATVRHPDPTMGESTLAGDAARLLGPLRGLKKRLVARVLFGELLNAFLAMFISALLVMALDAGIRWRTPLPRWTGSSIALSAALLNIALVLWRRRWSFSMMGLCERLEEIFPPLRGKLQSAVSIALATNDDPLAGSPQLQTRLLQRATHSLAHVDLANSLARHSFRRRIIFFAMCLAGMAIWAIAAPGMPWQAARRLAAPWRLDAWPRLVVLELSAPGKVARGRNVEIVARSKTSHLPPKATIFLADDRGGMVSQSMRREGGRFVYSVSKVKEPFWLRVIGGDDDQMRWRRVDVVEPVSLTATRLEAIPPAYAKAPSTRVGSEMTVLEGTRLLMEFRASRTIQEATPNFKGHAMGPLKVDSSGRNARGEITLSADTSSGASKLRVDVRDREDALVVGAWNGSIRVLRDLPPTIEWLAPKPSTKVQPQSHLLLEAKATDDVRLASLELRRRVVKMASDEGGSSAPWHTELAMPIEDSAKEQSISHEIDLGAFGLTPGDMLEWSTIAVDAKGQAKESEVLRCTVVDMAELRKENDRRLERFFEQLLDAARRAREIADELTKADQAEEDHSGQLAAVRAAQFDQRSLMETFSNPSGGILDAWRRVAQEQLSHQFVNEADREQLESVTHDLTAIADRDLPAVLHELEQIQNTPPSSSDATVKLATAMELAQKASDRIEGLLDQLNRWRKWSNASKTVEELLAAEQKLQEQAREAAPRFLGKLLDELDEGEKRLLKDLAAKQAALARQLAELPLPPGPEEEGWRAAREVADAQMSLAARNLAENKLNQADAHQSQAIDAIQKLSNAGALGGESSADRSEPPGDVNAPTEKSPSGPTEAQLKEVIARQTALRQKTREALDALQKPGANKSAVEAELAELAKAQADLAAQVEAWQAKGTAAPKNEESPRE